MSVENSAEGVILIVDDTPTNLGMLCDLLTDSGFEVLVATDGESAIDQAVYAQPNLILLDILMPGMDGFETCRQLKANQSTKDIPVIFMTALSQTADKVRGFHVGAVDYITKPIQPEEVLARITNHLTIQKLQKQLQKQNLQLQQEIGERQRAEELVRQQAQREHLLGEIAQRIRQSLDLEEILNTTVSEVRQFLQTDRVLIYQFLADWSGVVVVESVSSEGLSILNHTICDRCFGEGNIQPYQQGRILVVEDIYTANMTPCHVDLLANFQVRANLVVPILQTIRGLGTGDWGTRGPEFPNHQSPMPNRLWGLLIAHDCRAARRWQQWEVDFLKQLSTQIAIAIQQGQLYQRLRGQNQVLVDLAKSRTVNHGDLQSALRQFTEAAAQTLEISRVSVWLYSTDRSKICCRDLYDRSTNLHAHGMELAIADYPADFVLTRREVLNLGRPQDRTREKFASLYDTEQEPTIAVNDADSNPINLELQDSHLYDRTVLRSNTVTAILDAPIRVRDRVLGIVRCEDNDSTRQWTLDEQNFAGSIADFIALCLEARDRQRAEEEIRLLQTITQEISESQDFDSAVEVTLRQVCETIGWNFAEAWIPNSDGTFLESSPAWYASTTIGTRHALEQLRHFSQALRIPANFGLPGRAWSSKQPEWIQDVASKPEAVFVRSQIVIETGLCSCLAIPILANDRVLAVLVFFTFESREQDRRMIELVSTVAKQLGSVMQRKQAEEALRVAEQRYHSIVDNAIEGIFQATPSGRFLSANPAMARIFGYSSPEELIASIKDIAQQIYVDPNRRSEFIAAMQTDNAVFDFESLVYRKDGSVIWVSEKTRAVRDFTGTLLYYEGILSDITARKVTQEAFRYQREQTDQLLLNILPEPIAQQLKLYPSTIADSFEAVSVLFADIVGFTEFSARTSPKELVRILNLIFSKFDRLAEQHGLEKIKTIGDAYMVVAGLPTPRPDHAIAIAEMALDMQAEMVKVGEEMGEPFKLRIGINSGPVVAGVIGIKKFTYDLWGDTVNIASRMESHGIPGMIQVTAATYELLRDKYLFEERGVIPVKGKGNMVAYLLTGRKLD